MGRKGWISPLFPLWKKLFLHYLKWIRAARRPLDKRTRHSVDRSRHRTYWWGPATRGDFLWSGCTGWWPERVSTWSNARKQKQRREPWQRALKPYRKSNRNKKWSFWCAAASRPTATVAPRTQRPFPARNRAVPTNGFRPLRCGSPQTAATGLAAPGPGWTRGRYRQRRGPACASGDAGRGAALSAQRRAGEGSGSGAGPCGGGAAPGLPPRPPAGRGALVAPRSPGGERGRHEPGAEEAAPGGGGRGGGRGGGDRGLGGLRRRGRVLLGRGRGERRRWGVWVPTGAGVGRGSRPRWGREGPRWEPGGRAAGSAGAEGCRGLSEGWRAAAGCEGGETQTKRCGEGG